MSALKIIQALDNFGYNKTTAVKRGWIAVNGSKASTVYHTQEFGESIEVQLTGSRREGIGTTFECDVDQMFVDTAAICLDSEEIDSSEYSNVRAVYQVKFQLDTRPAPDGYAYLSLIKPNAGDVDIPLAIKDTLVLRDGSYLVRNDKMKLNSVAHLLGEDNTSAEQTGCLKRTAQYYEERTGPAAPFVLNFPLLNGRLKFDDVLALPCKLPRLTEEWCERERWWCEWPHEDLVNEIKFLDAHVVPVGSKGHPDEKLQWRICFTMAEIALVESFNDVQIKAYVFLKLLAKSVFNDICSNITSYVMKNIMFWLSENIPITEMETNDLLIVIRQALIYLRACVNLPCLPNYMIPARNLLAGKVTQEQSENLITTIDEMLGESIEDIANKIPELREEMAITDEDAVRRRNMKRDVEEQVLLAVFALPKEQSAKVVRLMIKAETIDILKQTFMTQVIPYIREHNPMGFFPYLCEDDTRILNYIMSTYCFQY